MPAMFGLALVADFIIVLLGDKWTDSVTLLRILCISGAFLPISTLYQNLFISHGRSDTYMWCSLVQIAVQLAVIMAFSTQGILTMVVAFTTIQILWIIVWQTLANRLITLQLSDVTKDILPFILSATFCVAIAYYTTTSITQPILLILLRIAITALLYLGIMKLARVAILNECIQFIFHRQ